MAPARVAKRFVRLYSRCEREIRRFEESDALASAMLRKILTIWERWHLLEQDGSYADKLLAEVSGLKSKVLSKQAKVLQDATGELEGALLELQDAVFALGQVMKESQAFLRNEYKGREVDPEKEDRTLTIAASEYVDGLCCIFTVYDRSHKLKLAVYEEIKACKAAEEREELSTYFVNPPCLDAKLVRHLLAKVQV